MELVEGSDLAQRVKKQGPQSASQAVECITQAARGLAAAHAAGIIHRDIKPSNLLLDAKGTVKILDMGLARIDAGNTPGAASDELTHSGSIMGTCDYMAPEQAANTRKADQRADVYSLGCTLYYLLAGTVMYPGETAIEKLLAHREDPIPELPNAPASLQAIYRRMVAKKPDDRFQNMAEVMAALEACRGELAGSAAPGAAKRITGVRPAGAKGLGDTLTVEEATHIGRPAAKRPRGRRWALAVGALLGAALVVGGGVAVLAPHGGLLARLSSGPATDAVPPSGSTAPETRPAGTEPAGTKPAGGKVDEAWIRSVRAAGPREQILRVMEKMRELNPRMGFRAVGHTIEKGVVTDLTFPGAHVEDLTPLRALAGLKKLTLNVPFAHESPALDLTPLKGTPLTQLYLHNCRVNDLAPLRGMLITHLDCRSCPVTDFAPLKELALKEVWLDFQPARDAEVLRSIKTLEKINDKPVAEFWKPYELPAVATPTARTTLNAVAGTAKSEHDGQVTAVAFSADSTLATATHGSGLKLWEKGKFDGPSRVLSSGGFLAVAFMANGRVLAAGESGGAVRHWDVATGAERVPLEGFRIPVFALAFAPLGKTLAVGQFGTAPHVHIWEVFPKKSVGQPWPVKDIAGAVPCLALSADGGSVAWAGKNRTVHVVQVAAGKEVAQLRGHTTEIRSLALSADGSLVAAGAEDGSVRVWETATGKERAVCKPATKSATIALAFAPDGGRLASGGWDGTAHLWDVATGRERALLRGHRNGVTAVGFAPDGKTLATGSRDATVKLWDVPAAK